MKISESSYVNILADKKINENNINEKEDKELMKAAKEFEAIFVKMMIDSMEKTVDKKNSLIYGGQGEEMFTGMLNEERSKNFVKSTNFGIADKLYEQLSRKHK